MRTAPHKPTEEQTRTARKKGRLYVESAKLRRTSHWDLDYLPLKEVERLYAQASAEKKHTGRKRKLFAVLSGRALGVLFIGLGLALLAAAILVGRSSLPG